MKLTRHATMWTAEVDDMFELDGDRCAHVWELLRVNVSLDARPYACYTNVVVFYNDEKQELGRCTHHDLSSAAPHLVHAGGRWWEVQTGTVVQREGRWCVKWRLCCNTRRALEANAGAEAEKQRELARAN